MQAMRDGKEKTIFACSRCGQLQRFDDEDIIKLKEEATAYFLPYDMTNKNHEYKGDQKKYDNAMTIINLIK